MDSFFGNLPPVSIWAVLLSAVIMMVVGSLWYSRLLFGRTFARHSHVRPTDIRPDEAKRGYAVSGVASLVTAYLLGMIASHAHGSISAILFSVGFIWLFIMIEQLNGFLWQRDSFTLFLLQAFRSLCSLAAGALVFLLWS